MRDEPAAPAMQRMVAEINRTHATHFRLGPRLPGGVNDACLLYESDRRCAVLKSNAGSLDDLQVTSRAVDRLRISGYPTPRWLFVGRTENGTTYHIQEFVPGTMAGCPTVTVAQQVVDLIERTAGTDIRPDRDLSERVVTDFRTCVSDLHQAGPAVRDVVERYERLVAQIGPIGLPRGDFVHGDLHWGNVLVHRGRVSAVVDIESCGGGTRAIDYARLLRDTYFPHRIPEPGVRDMIRRAGEHVAGTEALALCTSAAVLDNLRWRVDSRPERIAELIPEFLRLAEDLTPIR